MANKVTGSTDISKALSVNPNGNKYLLIVAQKKLAVGETSDLAKNVITKITSTSDAVAKFGSESKVPEFVRIAIINGISNIKAISVGTFTGTEPAPDYASIAASYSAAFDMSMKDNTIRCIALDVNDATVLTALSTHLDTAESEDLLRYSASCPDAIVDDSTVVTFAGTLNNKRIFVPSSIFVDKNQTALGGVYGALGLICSIMTETDDPALPLNGVEILGFGGVNRILLSSQKTVLIAGGVIPMYTSENGNPTIYRMVTSYTKDGEGASDATWQEGTTIFIADNVLESVENDLKNRFKRTKGVARIINAIKDAVQDVLEVKQGLEIIEDLDVTTITVAKDPTDIYGALVDYQINVVTPLYTITIKQHLVI